MAGKTLIDIDLRNELVEFLDNADFGLDSGDANKAQDLLWRLKPKRIVNKKKEFDVV